MLTWVLHISVGWKVTCHFHQCYQNTLTHRPKAEELWLVRQCLLKVLLIPGVHHPSQIHPLKSIYMVFACSKLDWHQSSSSLCPGLSDTKTLGQALLPLFLAATKEALPAAHTTHPHGSPASTRGGARPYPHSSACLCTVSEIKTQSQMLAQLVALPKVEH